MEDNPYVSYSFSAVALLLLDDRFLVCICLFKAALDGREKWIIHDCMNYLPPAGIGYANVIYRGCNLYEWSLTNAMIHAFANSIVPGTAFKKLKLMLLLSLASQTDDAINHNDEKGYHTCYAITIAACTLLVF
jgi:hypothetical protein